MRKLASIRQVKKISVINDKKGNPATSIELVQVDGWECVAKKGIYQEGDLVIYFEIDSILPESLLKKLQLWDETKGKGSLSKSKGNVLSTKKMLGVLSQGLLAPTSILENTSCSEGMDVSELLEITKYESNEEEQFTVAVKEGSFLGAIMLVIQNFLSNMVYKDFKNLNKLKWIGQWFTQTKKFPSFIKKTDQERVQNVGRRTSHFLNEKLVATEKLEGTSSTYYFNKGRFGQCSKNIELSLFDKSKYGKMQAKYSFFEKLIALGKNIAIQGEIVGPGIAKNYYELKENCWYCFNIYLIDENRNATPYERMHILSSLGLFKTHVPIINLELIISDNLQEKALELANMNSQINPSKIAEGLVFQKAEMGNYTFKAINNNYLLKQG